LKKKRKKQNQYTNDKYKFTTHLSNYFYWVYRHLS